MANNGFASVKDFEESGVPEQTVEALEKGIHKLRSDNKPHWCSRVRDIENECKNKLEDFNPANIGDITQR